VTALIVPTGLAIGAAADALFGDPRRFHPVAGLGRVAGAVERVVYRDHEVAGVAYTAVLVAAATGLTHAIERRLAPAARVALLAAATAYALGGTSLRRVAGDLVDVLEAGDLDGARARLSWLCARDPSRLDADALCRATLESVAENTSDAAVATLVWGALLGTRGVVLHRTVNTLDAMVGYRTTRYARFGWAAARSDDLLGLLPARLTALLTVALAPSVGGRARDALTAWRRDAAAHPSPNAGPVEAATAGALGVRLGGDANRYGDVVDHRPTMGLGDTPRPADVRTAIRLSRAVTAAALVACAATAAWKGRGHT
jgi:adenosylcobinamide-phosphate synthase